MVALHCLRENHRIFLVLFGLVLAPINLLIYFRGVPAPEQLSDFAHPFYLLSGATQLLFLVWLILLVDMAVKGKNYRQKRCFSMAFPDFPMPFLPH